MLDKNGQVHASYEGIKKQAIELGNLLPGTTADFINTARALMEQGVVYESVLHGGLRAASHLSVVLSMPSEQAGEMTAKLREAYKLTDNELPKMADLMQRGKFAFGMKPSDLMAAASYEAPVLNQLGISGLENANKMMAIQGIAAQVGLEGSSFGTNFSQMLSRLAKGPEMMEMAKKGMKGKAREIVEELGVTFEFFDDKGNFAGLDHMIKELEKLELIKNKAGQESALIVADALFGAEAGRPAMILAEQGLAGFQAARERMEQQAGLQQRIELITRSTSNTLEALGGSLENLGAALAGPVIQALHPLIHLLNVATGWLTTFAEAHPRVTKALGALALGLGAAASTFFTLGVVLSAGRVLVFGWKLFSTITGLSSGVAWLSGLLKGPLVAALGLARTSVIALSSSARAAGGGVLGLSRALGGALLSGLKMTGQAVLFLGRALFLNPVGLVITGIALGALLIYRYWRPIQGFFAGVWDGLKSGLAPVATVLRPAIAALGTAFGKLLDALGRLRPVLEIVFSPFLAVARLAIGAVRVLGGWLKELFTPVQDTGNAARQMGESFGQGIARALTWMGELLARFLSLPTRVIQAATDLANGIGTAFSGIGSFFTNAWDRIGTTFSDGLGKLTASIGNFSPLGLFQQAFSGVFDWCHRLPKSFADLGANLIDGLTSGITSKLTSVKDSMLSLGANARDWLAEKLGIHSPSTVFMSLGGDIGEGAALGILSSIPGVQSASGKLASAMMTGALAMTSAVGGTLPVNVQASAPVAIEQRIIPRIAAIPSAPAFHVPVQLPDLPETLRTLDPQITPRLGAMPRIAAMPSIPALSAPGSGIQESDPYPSAWRPQDSLIHDIQAAVQALPRTQGAEPSAPSAGDTIIHFSPNITIRGTGDAGEQAREALRLSVRELEQMLRRVEAERERRSY
jgi:TP901 family phage tail tape measure protein